MSRGTSTTSSDYYSLESIYGDTCRWCPATCCCQVATVELDDILQRRKSCIGGEDLAIGVLSTRIRRNQIEAASSPVWLNTLYVFVEVVVGEECGVWD
jgi:hypothetical protein